MVPVDRDVGMTPPHAERALSGVAETLLIPLYVRALESRRKDALLVDDRAVALVSARPALFAHVEQIRMDDGDRATLVLRNREFDRHARAFLARNAPAVVVHIGCGLDCRYERVDDGTVDWYDLDLPEVVAARRSLLGDEERGRHHLLATSALDTAWMEAVGRHRPRAFLFMAEGVFMYLAEDEVKLLVRALRERFPGSELVFDAFSPLMVRMNNLRLRLSGAPLDARYRWGLRSGLDLEGWSDGIRLIDEWFPLDQPEARLARYRRLRHVRPLARGIGIYRYRLGEAPA